MILDPFSVAFSIYAGNFLILEIAGWGATLQMSPVTPI
jgi:hypothetical protein